MKETVKINLNQRLFDLDADAYQSLKAYLDSLAVYFEKSGESTGEILQDIEQRIAEILEERLKRDKQVVTLQDVEDVIRQLGTVDDFERESEINDEEAENTNTGQQQARYEDYGREHRKLYRDMEHNILGGVCSGMASYFNVDPVWIRLAFMILFFINLIGLVLYIILWVIVPPAITTAQKLQMRGRPVTVENIHESVKSEFHRVKDNFKRYSQSESFRRTRETAGDVLATLGNIILVFLKVLLIIIGIVILVAIIVFGISFIVVISSGGMWHGWHFPEVDFWRHIAWLFHDFTLFTFALIAVIIIPLIGLLIGLIKLIFGIRSHNNVLSAFLWTFWALALVIVIVSFLTDKKTFSSRHYYNKKDVSIEISDNRTLYIDLERELLPDRGLDYYSVFSKEIIYDEGSETCYLHPIFRLKSSDSDKLFVEFRYNSLIPDFGNKFRYTREYDWSLNDTLLMLSNYLEVDNDAIWILPGLEIVLYVPDNQIVMLDDDLIEIAKKNDENTPLPLQYYNKALKVNDDKLQIVRE